MPTIHVFFRYWLAFVMSLTVIPAWAGMGQWTSHGPEGASVTSLLSSSNDPRRVYATVVGGGMFSSHDGGESWRPLKRNFKNHELRALARDPGRKGLIYAVGEESISRSFDGGANWQVVLKNERINQLAVDRDSGHLYAATGQGLLRGTTHGAEWSAVALPETLEGGPVSAVLVTAKQLLVVARAPDSTQAVLLRSADRGETWGEVAEVSPLIHLLSAANGALLGVAENRLLTADSDGKNWRSREFNREDEPSVNFILQSADGNTLYAGLDRGGLMVSQDNGETWQSHHPSLEQQNILSLLLHPETDQPWLVGTETGISRWDGDQWQRSQFGLFAARVTAVAADASQPGRVFCGTRFSGVFVTPDHGKTWRQAGSGAQGLPVLSLAMDPKNPRHILMGTDQQGLFRSVDGGDTWIAVGSDLLKKRAIHDLLFPQQTTLGIFAATDLGVYRSMDGGATWSERALDLNGKTVHALAELPNALIAGTNEGVFLREGAEIWRTPEDGVGKQTVRSLLVNPEDPNLVYLGTEGQGVYQSRDGGDTWTTIGLDGLIITALVAKPGTPEWIYAASDIQGVLTHQDGVDLWKKMDQGLYQRQVNALVASPTHPLHLYLGSEGGGFFQIDFSALSDFGLDPNQEGKYDLPQDIDSDVFGLLDAKHLPKLPDSALQQLNPEQLAQLSGDALAGLSPEQMAQLPPDALAGLTADNADGLPGDSIKAMSADQFKALSSEEIANMSSAAVAKLFMNLNRDEIPVSEVEQRLPPGWEMDATTGKLTAPPGAPIKLRAFQPQLPDNVRLSIEPPDLSSGISVGGDASEGSAVHEIAEALPRLGLNGFTLSQGDDGLLNVQGPGVDLSFLVDPDGVEQGEENGPVALDADAGGQLVLRAEGRTYRLLPAPKNLVAVADVLGGGQVDLATGGAVMLETNTSQRRASRIHTTVVFDSTVTTSTDASGVYYTSDTSGSVVYSDQTSQYIFPAIYDQTTFSGLIYEFAGTESVTFNADGTCTLVYSGASFKLSPTFNSQTRQLASGESVTPSLILNADLTLDYTVEYNGYEVTTSILISY